MSNYYIVKLVLLSALFVGLAIMARRLTKGLRPVKRWQHELAMICSGAFLGYVTVENFGAMTLFVLIGIGSLTVLTSLAVDFVKLQKAAR